MRVPNVGEEFGRYRLDRVLGQGGMGIVFAATDPRLGRTVALKVITGVLAQSPEFRARFQAEAAALARLDSPYVIAIHDHDEVDGTPYIVTQYVDGADLGTLLRDHGPMPARQALLLCAQLARGLGDAHRVGVIHRDVKPGNVLLRGAGTADVHAYLCDFGIARADGIEGPAPTATGMVAGTWSYLSPERTAGLPASPASDLYALGCLLWTCLTGREPYQGTDVQVALAHQSAPIPQLPGSGEFVDGLNALVARAMAKDPAERYDDAAALRADLERLAAIAPDQTVEGPAATPGAPTVVRDQGQANADGSGRRAWVPVALAVLALLLVGGGIATWLIARGEDDAKADDRPEPGVAGDLTGDGKGDVLIHQSRFDALSPLGLFTVPSTGLQFGSPQRASAEIGDPLFADVDGDAVTDVVWYEEEDDRMAITVVPGKGEKWTTELTLDPAFDIKGYNAETGDIDGDGKDDLILVGDPSLERDGLHVALSEGDGFAAPAQWYDSDLSDSQLWFGDFDGDDKPEIVYFGVDWGAEEKEDDEVEYLRLLRPEDGRLVEVDERVLGGAGVNPGLALWMRGDVNGDGDDELVVGGVTRQAVWVYDAVGDTLPPRVAWHTTRRTLEEAKAQFHSGTWRGAGLSDVDGDGDADLVELHEVRESEGSEDAVTELALFVQLSDGEQFADPEEWGRLECASECENSFDIVQ